MCFKKSINFKKYINLFVEKEAIRALIIQVLMSFFQVFHLLISWRLKVHKLIAFLLLSVHLKDSYNKFL